MEYPKIFYNLEKVGNSRNLLMGTSTIGWSIKEQHCCSFLVSFTSVASLSDASTSVLQVSEMRDVVSSLPGPGSLISNLQNLSSISDLIWRLNWDCRCCIWALSACLISDGALSSFSFTWELGVSRPEMFGVPLPVVDNFEMLNNWDTGEILYLGLYLFNQAEYEKMVKEKSI